MISPIIDSIVSGCEDISGCKCDLELQNGGQASGIQPRKKELVVGVDSSIELPLRIQNLGSEPSFSGHIEFSFPVDFPLGKNCKNTTAQLSNPEAYAVIF